MPFISTSYISSVHDIPLPDIISNTILLCSPSVSRFQEVCEVLEPVVAPPEIAELASTTGIPAALVGAVRTHNLLYRAQQVVQQLLVSHAASIAKHRNS